MEGNSNTKRKLKKEYIPLLVAILVLIALVLALIIVIFYKDDKGLIVPELPVAEALDIAVFDVKSGKYEAESFDSDDTKKVKVNYKLITDYYTNGVIISSPVVKFTDNEFIVASGPTAVDPYMSAIDKDGKLKWINKVSFKGYTKFRIQEVIKSGDYYYAFAEGIKDKNRDIVALKFNKSGNEEVRNVVLADTTSRLQKVVEIDNGFALICDGADNIKIITLAPSMNMMQTIYNLADDKNNIFNTSRPDIVTASAKGNIISIIVGYRNFTDEYMYMINYDMTKRQSTINRFDDLNKIDTRYTLPIYENKGTFLTVVDKNVYKFDSNGKMTSVFDYNKVKVSPEFVYAYDSQKGDNEEENKKVEESKKEVKNELTVENVTFYGSTILVTGKTHTHYVYDIFDKDMKLQKRYVLSQEEYNHNGDEGKNVGVLLNVFYIDGKLYKVHTYGATTPSIMISMIG